MHYNSPMGYGWEGDLVRLVPLDKQRHLDNALRWLNDPEVTAWLLIGDEPLTRLAEERWFDSMSERSNSSISFAIETLDAEHIGFSGLHGISERHGYASSGSFIGETGQWSRGFGTDAARGRAKFAFQVLGLRRLLSSHLEGNDRSKRMLEKAGYHEYGRLQNHLWKRGWHRDLVLMVADSPLQGSP